MDVESDWACQLARLVESDARLGAGAVSDRRGAAPCPQCDHVLHLVLASLVMVERRLALLERSLPTARPIRHRGRGHYRPAPCQRCGQTYLRKSAVGRYCAECRVIVKREQARGPRPYQRGVK